MSLIVSHYPPQACQTLSDPMAVSYMQTAHRSTKLTSYRMELTRQAGNEPPLVGLMRVYKDYYPDVIVGNATFGRASVFKVSTTWVRSRSMDSPLMASSTRTKSGDKRLGEIQDVHFQKTQDGLLPERRAFHVNRRDGNKSYLLPQVHTSNAQEVSLINVISRWIADQLVFNYFGRNRKCE